MKAPWLNLHFWNHWTFHSTQILLRPDNYEEIVEKQKNLNINERIWVEFLSLGQEGQVGRVGVEVVEFDQYRLHRYNR